jgi:hypothetical protein
VDESDQATTDEDDVGERLFADECAKLVFNLDFA